MLRIRTDRIFGRDTGQQIGGRETLTNRFPEIQWTGQQIGGRETLTNRFVALAFALIGAYAAYELVLFTATPFLGGEGNFTVAIVGRLAVLSVLWLIGLIAACEVFRLLTSRLRHQVS
jgi:hypothetical protein